jgi:acyl dehydratase
MRLLVDGLLIKSASLGSPGIEQIRWVQPVRPGDTLSARVTVLESRPSQSKPDRGTLKIRTEVTNQRGEQVMWMENFGMFGRRPAAG